MPKFINLKINDEHHYNEILRKYRGRHDKIVVHLISSNDSSCTAESQDQCRICPAKDHGCTYYWSRINPPLKTLK